MPIVFVSIYSLRSEVALLEPDAYLVKPFSLAELTSALRRAVEKDRRFPAADTGCAERGTAARAGS